MRQPIFSATLIHGSCRLTALTLPALSASRRCLWVPALVILISSRLMKPSIILSMVKCEPLNWLTAIGTFLSCSGSKMPVFGSVTIAKVDIAEPSATILAVRCPLSDVGLDRALHDAPLAHAELVALALVVERLHGAREDVVLERAVVGGGLAAAGRGEHRHVEALVAEIAFVARDQQRQVVDRVHHRRRDFLAARGRHGDFLGADVRCVDGAVAGSVSTIGRRLSIRPPGMPALRRIEPAAHWRRLAVRPVRAKPRLPRPFLVRRRSRMNILLLGSGGREHALAWKIAASPLADRLYLRARQCRASRGRRNASRSTSPTTRP